MKRLLLIILFIIDSSVNHSQQKINISLEGGLSLFNGFETYKSFMRDINLVLQYNNLELYGGIIQLNNSGFSFKNNAYTVLGPILGAKYHIRSEKRLSHFYLDLNVHWRHYFLSLGTPPIGVKTLNFEELNSNYFLTHDMKTFNSHINIGYEPVILKRVSFPITAGIGLAYHNGTALPFGINLGYSDVKKVEFSPYVKLGIRIYMNKVATNF